MSEIQTLIERRIKALADAQSIVDEALRSDRALTPEEEQSIERATADAMLAQRAIELAEQRAEAERAMTAAAEVAVPAVEVREQEPVDEWQPIAELVRSGSVGSGSISGLERRGSGYVLPWERRTDTPLTTTDTSTTYSGYLVPTRVADSVEELAYKYSAILRAGADIIVTPGINTLHLPKVTALPTFTIGTEATAPNDSSQPTFDRTTLSAYRVGNYTIISKEELASTEIDMAAYAQRILTQSLAQAIAAYLATGTGSSQPQGLFVGASTGKTAASATTFTADEVIDAWGALGAEYWPNAKVFCSQAAFTQIVKLRDSEDRPLFMSSYAGATPGTLLGLPLFVDPQGPALTTGKKPIVFGDPSHFHVRIGMGGGVEYEVSDEAKFTQWARVVRVAQWVDAKVGVAAAFKALTLA